MSLRQGLKKLKRWENLPETQGTLGISLLIPARASSHSLAATVEAANAFLEKHFPDDYEIIVTPNTPATLRGDKSLQTAQALTRRYPNLRVVPHDLPIGKGAGLRTAFQASRGRIILFTDADLPYDLEFFERAVEKLKQGYGFVTGNRRLRNSYFDLPVPLLRLAYRRHRLGLLFNAFARLLLPIHTTDTQAGIKVMSRAFAFRAFSLMRCPGFFFDLELFLTAHGHGFRHAELPVQLRLENEKSTVRVLRESVLALTWLTRITAYSLRGHYGRRAELDSVLSHYPPMSLGSRLFLNLRWRLTPYSQMIERLPLQGSVLDLGCGHGLLSVAAALDSSDRQVVGLDHDARRIQVAQSAGQSVGNLQFRQGGWEVAPRGPFQGVAIIDVLHYLNPEEQRSVLRRSFEALAHGGTLLVREVDPQGGVIARWNQAYEKLATGIGFTRSKRKTDHTFRTRGEWEKLLRDVGFSVHSERCSSALFADILYVCERPRT